MLQRVGNDGYGKTDAAKSSAAEDRAAVNWEWLHEMAEPLYSAGYLLPKAEFIDGTHIKTSANTNKQGEVVIPTAFRRYAQELMEEVNADREVHRKVPFDVEEPPKFSGKKHRDNTACVKSIPLTIPLF